MSNKYLLSGNIKKYRKRLGWTQQDLAIKSDLPFSLITKIEQGLNKNPSLQTLIKLKKALNISIDKMVSI